MAETVTEIKPPVLWYQSLLFSFWCTSLQSKDGWEKKQNNQLTTEHRSWTSTASHSGSNPRCGLGLHSESCSEGTGLVPPADANPEDPAAEAAEHVDRSCHLQTSMHNQIHIC